MKNVDEKIKIADQIRRHADLMIGLAAVAAELGLYVTVNVNTYIVGDKSIPEVHSNVRVWEPTEYLNYVNGEKVTE